MKPINMEKVKTIKKLIIRSNIDFSALSYSKTAELF